MTRETLTGWGRTAPVSSEVVHPTSEAEVLDILAAGRPVAARGLGRSYGDAAQLAGGVVVDNRGLAGVSSIDRDGAVRVGAGVSIDELLTDVIPRGWFVAVTPGTRQVTMAGAVASDVHGKGHHVDGTFSQHVVSLRLATPSGVLEVGRDENPELFWATAGGMGLTGIITEVTLRLRPIETDLALVDTDRFGDLASVMAEMRARDHEYHYSVAWVDCMRKGASMGRSILERGRHARADEVDEVRLDPPRAARLAVPFTAPPGLLNSLSIRAFNEAWFRKSPAHRVGEPRLLTSFFHPLDGVRSWNRLYGPRGFVQYQFVVPEEADDTVASAIERLSSSGVPSFFAVLKRFGPANPGLLSFPRAGWTLALDMPVGPPALPGVLDDLDEMVARAGGRVYLAKDARLDAATAASMYPRIPEFARIRATVDPEGLITSDLARRLGLSER